MVSLDDDAIGATTLHVRTAAPKWLYPSLKNDVEKGYGFAFTALQMAGKSLMLWGNLV